MNSLLQNKYIKTGLILLICLTTIKGFSQADSTVVDSLKLSLPADPSFKTGTEEDDYSFSLKANRHDSVLQFSMQAPPEAGMNLNSNGRFSWTPAKNLVSASEREKMYPVLFRVTDGVMKDSAYVEFTVKDKPEPVIPQSQMPKIVDLEFPLRGNWKVLHEGDSLQFKLNAKTSDGQQHGIKYQLEEGDKSNIEFDSLGNFFWVPGYDYVNRLEEIRQKNIFIVAEDSWGNVVSDKVVFSVFHRNRRPVIENLKPFYVLLNTKNIFKINTGRVRDPDGDPIVFVTKDEDLPTGMDFSSNGRVSWSPSRSQFNKLRRDPIKVPFYVEDQPDKEQTKGYLTVEASHQDMPPEITVIPRDTTFTIDENEGLHLVFHLSDPNGDEDVEEFGFVSDDARLTQDLLRKNTNNQYEFIWKPSYSFVNDPDLFLDFDLRFFVLDKSKKTSEKVIKIRVKDTEDLAKKDTENYTTYKETLMETMNLMDQLAENQKHLEKELKLAKKGKKNRSLISVAIGALTGLSPVITKTADTQKTITVIGGTSTVTLGTLEAKDVIGKSVSDTNSKIKINTDLYNQLLTEGASLARRYNSKLNRRNQNFSYDLEKLKKLINSPKISELEMDAAWENKKKLSNRRLKSTFTDFDIIDND